MMIISRYTCVTARSWIPDARERRGLLANMRVRTARQGL